MTGDDPLLDLIRDLYAQGAMLRAENAQLRAALAERTPGPDEDWRAFYARIGATPCATEPAT